MDLKTAPLLILLACLMVNIHGYSFRDEDLFEERCHLHNIQTHLHFEPERFTGQWHLISDYNVEGSIISNFMTISDVRANFSLTAEKELKIDTAARVSMELMGYSLPYMASCFEGESLTCKTDPQNPTKFIISYQTSWDSLINLERPYWLIATDYNYALFYSCFEIHENGACKPSETYAWTLNRSRDGHTAEQLASIDQASRRVCIGSNGNNNFRRIQTASVC